MKNRRINKDCPKCGGNMFHIDDTYYGEYEQCLQCGFIKYPNAILLTEPKEDLVGSES